jgi:LuxR family transcriptional regulator, maltose regulon positive regulatory protein
MTLRPFLPAKFVPPRLPAVVRRDRLVQRLDAARDTPCTWICGPGGSGKTTLAADYLQGETGRSLWFNVDEGDADPSTAIANLILLARYGVGDDVDLPFLAADHALDPVRFHRLFFRRFYAYLDVGDVLVFDSCERAASAEFLLLLRVAVEEIPAGIRVLVLSRHWLPDALLKGLADRRIVMITADDLRLDLPESIAVAQVVCGETESGIEALHRLSDGWAAGLVLMLSARGSLPVAQDRDLNLSSREAVFGYFASELFDEADLPLRNLMLRTCLLPWVDAVQAETLTQDPDAGSRLDQLHRRHLFTVRRDGISPGARDVYVYHDLFRAFLAACLERTLHAEEIRVVRETTATLLEGVGLISEAVTQWRRVGRWAEVARLIRVDGQRLVDQGQWRTLAERLEGIPPAMIEADPWLLYFQGQATAGTAPAQAVALIQSAHERFQDRGDVPGQFNAAFAQMQLLATVSSNYKPWDRWIDVLGDLLEGHPPDDPVLAVRTWHTFLFVCFYRRPRHPLIGRAIATLADALFSRNLPPAQSIQAATGLMAFAHFACDTELAERTLPVLARHVLDEQVGLLTRTIGATWRQVYHYFNAQYREALECGALALELADQGGFTAMALALRWYRVQSRLYLGERDAALREAAQLGSLPRGPIDAYPTAYAATSESLAHFAAGDTALAIAVGEQGIEAWEQNGFMLARLGWALSMQAVYRMASGDADGALALVADAESGLADTVCNYPFSLHALLRAHAALARGNRDEAARHMALALAPAGNRKRLAVLRWAGPMLPPLLSLAWEYGIAREAIAELVDEWNLDAPTPGTPHWPRRIELFLLGRFEVTRSGVPLDLGRKPPRKVLTLLQAIALGGARGLGLENVRELLWPDQDGDAAAAAQTAALHRLRKLLNVPDAVLLREGRLLLNPACTWSDAVAFERLAASDDARDQQDALALYRGALLPHGEDAGWCVSARLRLRDRFVRLIERMASRLAPTEALEAEALFRRGIDAEPLVEACYLGLMRCCLRSGKADEALAVFRRLESTLAAATGLSPSAHARQLAQACREAAACPPLKAADTPPADRRSTVPPPYSPERNGRSNRR